MFPLHNNEYVSQGILCSPIQGNVNWVKTVARQFGFILLSLAQPLTTSTIDERNIYSRATVYALARQLNGATLPSGDVRLTALSLNSVCMEAGPPSKHSGSTPLRKPPELQALDSVSTFGPQAILLSTVGILQPKQAR